MFKKKYVVLLAAVDSLTLQGCKKKSDVQASVSGISVLPVILYSYTAASWLA